MSASSRRADPEQVAQASATAASASGMRDSVAAERGASRASLVTLDADGFVTLPSRVAFIVCEVVAERRAIGNAYRDEGFFLDEADALGDGEGARYAERGGFWNATDPGRAAEGLTLSDATALRKALLAIGVRVSHDDADALLCACERGAVRTAWEAQGRTGRDPDAPAQREARLERKRDRANVRREVARANGRCIVCCRTATEGGKATCGGCQRSANVRLVARRKKRARLERARVARAKRKQGVA